MKKGFCLLLFLSHSLYSFSQDLTNWYKDWENEDVNTYGTAYPYNLFSSNLTQSYGGEYIIVAKNLPWNTDYMTLQLGQYVLANMYMTHQVEIVSFPFAPECAFTGCGGTTNREMRMPIDNNFNSFKNAWEYSTPGALNYSLYNVTDELPFDFWGGNWVSNQQFPYSLSSASFHSFAGYSQDREVLPQTILKHTIRLRCNQNLSSPVLSSITFYSDLTRGTMMEYPFISTNSGTDAIHYDVTVMPGVQNDFSSYGATNMCSYGEGSNVYNCTDGTPNWIGDVIDYTPFDISSDDNLCQGFPANFLVNSQNDA